jgi:F0F1-type ATP synthase membrane subunit c/vacuolar-type H+-ATPase subunit K
MKSVALRSAAVLALLIVTAAPVLAQQDTTAGAPAVTAAAAAAANERTGPGIGIGLSVIGIGLGLGLIGYAALSGVARQPEQAGTIRGLMILLAALVEGAGIIGILFSLAMVFLG